MEQEKTVLQPTGCVTNAQNPGPMTSLVPPQYRQPRSSVLQLISNVQQERDPHVIALMMMEQPLWGRKVPELVVVAMVVAMVVVVVGPLLERM